MAPERRWSRPSLTSVACATALIGAAALARCTTNGHTSAEAPAAKSSVAAPAPAPAPAPMPATASAPPSATAIADAAEQRHAYVIAAVGDSLTDYASHGGRYLRYIEKRCPETRIDNFGKGGFMVNQMRRRFFAEVLPNARPYTHVIVFGGVNDLYSDLTAGRTPNKISADLSAMYAAARERRMQVVAVTVAPWGGFLRYYNERRAAATHRLNDWIRDQRQAGAVDHLVDAYALLSCGDSEQLCPRYEISSRDGLHLGPAGQEQLGSALFEGVFKDCR